MKKKSGSNNVMTRVFLIAAIVLVAWAMIRLIFMPRIIAGTTGIVVSLLLGVLFAFFAWRCWQDSVAKLPSPAKEPEDAAPVFADRPAPSVTFSFDDLDPADRVSLKRALEVQEDELVEMGKRRKLFKEQAEKLDKAQKEREELIEEGKKAIQ